MALANRLDFAKAEADTPTVSRVVIEHLTKFFSGPKGERICAAEDLTLTVEDKELLVLVGPSGCGKTTALRLIAGLETPTEGSIALDGQVIDGVAPRERDIAMVFQNYALYPHMSVYENLAFGLKVRQLPRSEIERRVTEAAELLDLKDCLERKPMELSGGQQQRVAVGRAVVRRPRLFLFDEPLSNLDPQLRAHMRAEISKVHRRLATTMLYVTHDQAEAMTLGHRVAVMKDGRIQQVDEPTKVYDQPANLFVAGFFGSPPMNLLNGTVARKERELFFEAGAGPGQLGLRLPLGRQLQAAAFVGKSVALGIRPEDVLVRPQPEGAPTGRLVKAKVEIVQRIGPETLVYLAAGGQELVAQTQSTESLRAGQEVWAIFEAGRERLFDSATGNTLSL